MINWLLILLVLLISTIVITIEYSIYKRMLTPTVVLIIPFAMSLLSNLCISPFLDSNIINYKTSLFVLSNIIIFFTVGQVCSFIQRRGDKVKLEYNFALNHRALYKICFILALTSIAVNSFKLITILLEIGFDQITSHRFELAYSYGLPAHLRLISYFTIFYFMYDAFKVKRKSSLIISILLILLIFITQVKFTLIWIILGITYLLVLEKFMKLKIKNVIFIILVLFVAFGAVYAVSIGSIIGFANVFTFDFFQFLTEHFYFYFTSPLLGLDVLLSNESLELYDIKYFFAVPYNIFANFAGIDFVDIIHEHVNISLERSTNVFTIFGSIYMNLGYLGVILIGSLISIYSHVLYNLSRVSKNVFIKILNVINLAMLTTGFFGYDYNKLFVYEVSIMILIMFFLSRSRKGVSNL